MPKEINKANFDPEVLKSSEPVLLDFWAPWCGPCRRMAPILDEIEKDLTGKVKVGKLNVDENPELANQFQVMSIPTLIVFKGGQVVEKIIGLTAKPELMQILQKHISR
ncbi:MAG: thioredoxin [Proteobacteria bacterium]|nr:thioredoxin [Pseudomonadota bacterium]